MTGNPASIRVLTVDDHPLMRQGIAVMIESQPDMVLLPQAATAKEGIRIFREHRPDVTLMDLRLPDIGGIDALITIRNEFPNARVIMLTTFEGDVEIQRALAAGARGYVLKSSPLGDLVQVIREVHAGRKRLAAPIASRLAEHLGQENLTAREVEVLMQIAEGNRNQDIANHLTISEETVKVHIRHIMDKLGAKDRTESLTIAIRRGIISL